MYFPILLHYSKSVKGAKPWTILIILEQRGQRPFTLSVTQIDLINVPTGFLLVLNCLYLLYLDVSNNTLYSSFLWCHLGDLVRLRDLICAGGYLLLVLIVW